VRAGLRLPWTSNVNAQVLLIQRRELRFHAAGAERSRRSRLSRARLPRDGRSGSGPGRAQSRTEHVARDHDNLIYYVRSYDSWTTDARDLRGLGIAGPGGQRRWLPITGG